MSFSSTNMCDGEGVSRYMSVSVTLPRNNQSILKEVGGGELVCIEAWNQFSSSLGWILISGIRA